jgi:hypothetical protein
MAERKRFAITVAKKVWAAIPQVIVVHIPWDQFAAPGGPEAYMLLVERTGASAVIASRRSDGTWASTTKLESVWKAIREVTPLETMEWHTMAVESDRYPWELFGPRA